MARFAHFRPFCRHLARSRARRNAPRPAIVLTDTKPAPARGLSPRIPGRSHAIGGPLATSSNNSGRGARKGGVNDPSMTDATSSYDAEDITVLEGLEAVRKRPGLYIGSPRGVWLLHLPFGA